MPAKETSLTPLSQPLAVCLVMAQRETSRQKSNGIPEIHQRLLTRKCGSSVSKKIRTRAESCQTSSVLTCVFLLNFSSQIKK